MRTAITRIQAVVILIIVLVAGVGASVYYYAAPGSGTQTTTSSTRTSSAPAGTLIVGTTEYPSLGISPYNNSLDTGFNIGHAIYEGLVSQRPDGTLIPDLATSWSSNANASVWTFQLRQGVKFQDGTPFNASAVVTSIDVALTTQFGQLAFGPYVKAVKAVSNYVVQFELKTPYAGFPAILTTASGLIASPSAYLKNKADFGTTVNVGTGPFSFVRWVPNSEVDLKANLNYWNASGIPKVDRLIWKFFTDSNALVLALRSGEVNVIYQGVPKTQISTLAAVPGLKYVKFFDSFTYFLGMNTQMAPFNNPLVRKAVAYAINYDQIVALENATRAYSLFPTPIFGAFNADAQKNFTYNPTYAKQLMARAGYPNGFNMTLDLYYPALTFGPEMPQVVTVIQQNLGAIGLNIVLKAVDAATLSKIVNARQAPLAIYRAGTLSSDPDFLATFTYSTNALNGWQRWGFNNATANSLVVQARETINMTQRVALYHQLQDLFDSQPSHIIFLYNNVHYVFFQDTVHGISSSTVGSAIGFEVPWSQVSISS